MSHEDKLSAVEHCDSARISLHFRQRFALFTAEPFFVPGQALNRRRTIAKLSISARKSGSASARRRWLRMATLSCWIPVPRRCILRVIFATDRTSRWSPMITKSPGSLRPAPRFKRFCWVGSSRRDTTAWWQLTGVPCLRNSLTSLQVNIVNDFTVAKWRKVILFCHLRHNPSVLL